MRSMWTEEQAMYLKTHYGTKPIKEIALELGFKYQQVVSKANNLGLNAKKISGESWTEKEDQLLGEHFEYAPKNLLMELFPTRSWTAITQRGLKTLKLNRQSQDRYKVNYKFFEHMTPESAYVLGIIISDGYVVYKKGPRKNNVISTEMNVRDIDVLEKIREVMSFEGEVRRTPRDTAVLSMSNVKLIEDLISLGVPTEDKTFTAVFPDIAEKLYPHFVRGLFDGDGSIYEDQGLRFQLLGTEKLLQSVMEIMPVKTKKLFDRNSYGVNVFVMKFGKKDSDALFKWMYEDSTIHMNRKYEKYLSGRIQTP